MFLIIYFAVSMSIPLLIVRIGLKKMEYYSKRRQYPKAKKTMYFMLFSILLWGAIFCIIVKSGLLSFLDSNFYILIEKLTKPEPAYP